MEIKRQPRHPLHGRAQVMLPDQRVVAGHSQDISVGGICIILDDPIPLGTPCTIRFEMFVNGNPYIFVAPSKSVYGVFASQGGFRAGFSFAEEDPQRTSLIKSLVGKKPMAETKGPETPIIDL